MDSSFGIIDLGSNTFHLLIVSKDATGHLTEIHKERAFVGLAEDGIEKLSDVAMSKGKAALERFMSTIHNHNITNYKAVGTAALRSASNSAMFINNIKSELGLSIEIIDGDREAELIYKGVEQLADLKHGNHVIMDVGGGSVEFILIKNGSLYWAKSYNLGVGVLHSLFDKSDPLSIEDQSGLNEYLNTNLSELQEVLKDTHVNSMIGASGSFEVVHSLNGREISSNKISEITLHDYESASKLIKESTFLEREQMENLPSSRVKLIVVAMILIDKALSIINPNQLLVSPYALKEGVISELV